MAVVEIARGTSTANNTTVTATVGDLPAALTSGHLIAVVAKNDDAADNVFSDTDGLTWTTDDQHNHFSNVGVAIGSAQITGGVTVDDGHVFTCTMSSASRKALIVYHVDDLDTTSWVDENGRNNESTQTTVDATLDATTDEADTLVIMGASVVSDGSLGWTPGGTDGDVVDTSNRSLVTSWHEETSAGTHSESGTVDSAGNFAAVVVAYIKAAGGGGTEHFGAASLTLTAGVTSTGTREVLGAAAQTLTVGVTTTGTYTAVGSASLGLTVGTASAGTRTTFGSSTSTYNFNISTSSGGAIVTGAASLTVTVGVASAGVRTSLGAASLTITTGIVSVGARVRLGAASLTVTTGIASAGTRASLGASSLGLTVGIATAARAGIFGAASVTLLVGATTAGINASWQLTPVNETTLTLTPRNEDAGTL